MLRGAGSALAEAVALQGEDHLMHGRGGDFEDVADVRLCWWSTIECGHFGQPGYETDLLYMAGIFALLLGGVGPLALDRLLFYTTLAACRTEVFN